MKKCSLVVWLVLSAVGSLLAQRTITGTVTDQQGEPLIGASVLVEDTQMGTITDIDGRYTLEVPETAERLVFSYTGFSTETVEIGASNVIDVTLQEGVVLDEAIVTAVGLESNRRQLGYSVQNVDADEVVGSRETNVVNALNGKVAGVNITSSSGAPGASSNIRIRGATSISRTNSPLFVIDGVPIDNSEIGNGVGGVDQSNRAIDINPNDISSISVLKGPAATALYGVRAANGAVIITTKKGAEGKAQITFNANYALDQYNQVPELQSAYAQGRPSGGAPIWRGPHTAEGFSWGPAISDLEYSNDPNHPNAPGSLFFFEDRYTFDPNGFLVPSGTGNGNPAQVYDQYDFFKTGNTYDVNLQVRGGTDRIRYFFSGGRLESQGIAPNGEWARNSLRLTTDAQLTDKLNVGLSANYVNSGGFRVQRGSNIQGIMLGLLRTTPTFDNGNGKSGQAAADDPGSYILPSPAGAQRSYRAGVYDNPYWVVNKNPFEDNVSRLIGYVTAGYEFLPSLKLNYKLGLDQYTDRRNWAFDINNQLFGSFDGAVNQGVYTNRDLNSDLFLQFNQRLSDFFSVSAIVGHNYFDTKYVSQQTNGFTLAASDFYHISNASDIQGFETINRKKLMGLYGTVDLNFGDYLFLNLTGRNDWSSALPEDDNNFQSYSASLGWAFTEMLGLQNNPVLPYGKLRLSYGKVGNDAPIYATTNYFNSAFNGGDGFISGIQYPSFGLNAFERSTQLGNNMLLPESTTTFEVGGEFKFFRGRVGLDVTYYDSESRDQVIPVQISSVTGFTSVIQNAGRVTNKGWELVLGITPVRSQNFTWDIEANWTTYENIVEELAEGVTNIFLSGFTSTQSTAQVGEPYGAIWGDPFAYNDQGQRLIDADGWPILGTSKVVMGDPNPDWFGGLRNTFTFYGVRVSALLDFRKGGDMWCGTCGILDYFGTSQPSGDLRDESVVFEGVLPDGTQNNISVPYADPAAGLGGNYWIRYGFGGISEMSIYDTSWLRLRELTVSYNFPSNLFNNIAVEGASLTFTGRNLWLDTEYPGIDPETNLTGASNGIGLDYFNMPNTKSYNLGLQVIF